MIWRSLASRARRYCYPDLHITVCYAAAISSRPESSSLAQSKLTQFLVKSCGYNPKKDIVFVPISGLFGTNIKDPVEPKLAPWYKGGTLFSVRYHPVTSQVTRHFCVYLVAGRNRVNPAHPMGILR